MAALRCIRWISSQRGITSKRLYSNSASFELNKKLNPSPTSGKTFEVHDVATGTVIGKVNNMTVDETKKVISAAKEALPEWQAFPAKEKAAVLHKLHNLIMANEEYFVKLITGEGGKPYAESRGEVAYGAAYVTWFAEEAKRVYGSTIPSNTASQRILVLRQPVGVCSAITPWNFPLAMITRKVAAALAAGCTAVVKPAHYTPLTAQAFAMLAEEAGVPKGGVGLVTACGSTVADVGEELVSNPMISKVTFTGSTPVGEHLAGQASRTMKKISMELGGNAPFIVFEDADLDAAIEGLLVSKFRNSGQTCVCANRVFLHESISDAFVEKLQNALSKFVVGPGWQEGVSHGPLINEGAVDKVVSLVDDAKSKGAQVVMGGNRMPIGKTFYEPTIITGVTPDMKIAQDEIFGPVAAVQTFSTDDEVLRLANDTNVGLAAYFYSRDLSRVWNMAEKLEVGMVGVNSGLISNEAAPFGGVKESGVGREGSFLGLNDYINIKYILMDI